MWATKQTRKPIGSGSGALRPPRRRHNALGRTTKADKPDKLGVLVPALARSGGRCYSEARQAML